MSNFVALPCAGLYDVNVARTRSRSLRALGRADHAFAPNREGSAMPFKGVMNPQQLAILTAALDDFCQKAGIQPGTYEFDEAPATSSCRCYRQGATTAEALSGGPREPASTRNRIRPSSGLATSTDNAVIARSRRLEAIEACHATVHLPPWVSLQRQLPTPMMVRRQDRSTDAIQVVAVVLIAPQYHGLRCSQGTTMVPYLPS